MQPHEDAFGQMMIAALNGKPEQEVVERDDGYINLGRGPALYFAPFESWSAAELEASAYVQGRVLDLGCGAGRHALYFQARGHEVVATDISPLAVQVCNDRGIHDVRVLSITQVSKSLGMFDTITLWGSFGMMGTPKRARWLLRRFHSITPKNGRIIAAALNPYGTDDPAHLDYQERNRQRGRMGGQVRLRVRYHQYATPWFDHLFVSPDELTGIVEGTGWQITHQFGNPNGQYIAIMDKT